MTNWQWRQVQEYEEIRMAKILMLVDQIFPDRMIDIMNVGFCTTSIGSAVVMAYLTIPILNN